jgi:hypothetical protein
MAAGRVVVLGATLSALKMTVKVAPNSPYTLRAS